MSSVEIVSYKYPINPRYLTTYTRNDTIHIRASVNVVRVRKSMPAANITRGPKGHILGICCDPFGTCPAKNQEVELYDKEEKWCRSCYGKAHVTKAQHLKKLHKSFDLVDRGPRPGWSH